MEWLTILVAVVGVIGVLALGPRRGLLLFLIISLVYPDFMRFYVGTAEVNPHRIMIVLLLILCMATPSIWRRFHWNALDTAMVVMTVICTMTLCFSTPVATALKNRMGDMMDTLCVYLVVRMLITDRASLIRMIKVVGIVLVPLAALSVYESATGWNPYITLANYSTHTPHDWVHELRHGFNRAGGPWVSPIMFGMLFASAVPLLRLLRHERPPWRTFSFILCGVALIGLAATLSSGPYMMLIVIAGCLWLERHRQFVKPLLIIGITGCLVVEMISHRHFYDVLADRVAMDAGNAWYRSQLIRRAIDDLPNYWLVGYGFKDPGWGVLIDERATDGCNDYVARAAAFGLPGLFSYMAVLVIAMYMIIRTYRRTADAWLRSYIWALGAMLIGMMLAFATASPFKIMITMFYITIGLAGSLSTFAALRPAPLRRRLRAGARGASERLILSVHGPGIRHGQRRTVT